MHNGDEQDPDHLGSGRNRLRVTPFRIPFNPIEGAISPDRVQGGVRHSGNPAYSSIQIRQILIVCLTFEQKNDQSLNITGNMCKNLKQILPDIRRPPLPFSYFRQGRAPPLSYFSRQAPSSAFELSWSSPSRSSRASLRKMHL